MAGGRKSVGCVNFHELPRKRLQSLCKKHGFPANKTNQAMADALSALLNTQEQVSHSIALDSPTMTSQSSRFSPKDMEASPMTVKRTSGAYDEDSLPTISASQQESLEVLSTTLPEILLEDSVRMDVAHGHKELEGVEFSKSTDLKESEEKGENLLDTTGWKDMDVGESNPIMISQEETTSAIMESKDMECSEILENAVSPKETVTSSAMTESKDMDCKGVIETRNSPPKRGPSLGMTDPVEMDCSHVLGIMPNPEKREMSIAMTESKEMDCWDLSTEGADISLEITESNKMHSDIISAEEEGTSVEMTDSESTALTTVNCGDFTSEQTGTLVEFTDSDSIAITSLECEEFFPERAETSVDMNKSEGTITNIIQQETPLPLSIMPHSPPTELFVSSDEGVRLFVDLNNLGFPRLDMLVPNEGAVNISMLTQSLASDSLRRECKQGMSTDSMEEEILGRNKTSTKSEQTCPQGVGTMGAQESRRGEQNDIFTIGPRTNISTLMSFAGSVKSGPFSSEEIPPLTVSFGSPVTLASPSLTNGLYSQRAEECSDGLVSITDQIHVKPLEYRSQESEKGSMEGAAAAEPLSEKQSVQSSTNFQSEEQTRSCRSEVCSPVEGRVKVIVNMLQRNEGERMSSITPSATRKDNYKQSPLVRSSRIAADIERASRMGQIKRTTILAGRRLIQQPINSLLSLEDDLTGGTVDRITSASETREVHVEENPEFEALAGVALQECGSPPTDHQKVVVSNITKSDLSRSQDFLGRGSRQVPIAPSRSLGDGLMAADTIASASECRVAIPDGNPGSRTPPPVVASTRFASHHTDAQKFLRNKVTVADFSPSHDKELSTTGFLGIKFLPFERESALAPSACLPASDQISGVEETDSTVVSAPRSDETVGAGLQRNEGAGNPVTTGVNLVSEAWMYKPTKLPTEKFQKVKEKNRRIGSAIERKLEHMERVAISVATKGELSNRSSVVAEVRSKAETAAAAASPTSVSMDDQGESISDRVDVDMMEVCTPVHSAKNAREIPASTLSPLDGNLPLGMEAVGPSPKPSTPKSSGSFLDEILRQTSVGKENIASSICAKENDRLRRHQELHKTPLTGRSKEKALRAAEIKAACHREKILRNRRGFLQETDLEASLSTSANQSKQVGLSRLL